MHDRVQPVQNKNTSLNNIVSLQIEKPSCTKGWAARKQQKLRLGNIRRIDFTERKTKSRNAEKTPGRNCVRGRTTTIGAEEGR